MPPSRHDNASEIGGVVTLARSPRAAPPAFSAERPPRRLRIALVGCLVAALLSGISGCNGRSQPAGNDPQPDLFKDLGAIKTTRPPAPDSQSPLGPTRLTDVHAEVGLTHVYDNGARGRYLMVEATGGGAGWLDYDGDGWWDLYANQGGDPSRDPSPEDPSDRLFRNLEGQSFRDVSQAAGLVERYFGQGVAVADYDGDGFDDVYVTNVGRNTLFHNQGDGTFLEQAAEAGVTDPRWSSSAAWGDLDGDGDLDLYVCNYVQYDPQDPIPCFNAAGQPSICHPKDVEHWPDECYFNQGDGTFVASAEDRGLVGPGNKALSAVIADFNNDGFPDIYVANDTTPNFFFVNQGDATFRELASLYGCAVNRNGDRQASMGLAVGDYDGNGCLDVYATHFFNESNTLYKNFGGDIGFKDVTGLEGLHAPTLFHLAFGTVMVDFDQDGRQELLITNGHINNLPENEYYRMTPQLFKFNGSASQPRWHEFTAQGGEFFTRKRVGRGIATCDFDGDGDPDAAVIHQNDPLALLRNDSPRGHWLQLRFRGRGTNRRAIGTRVILQAGPHRWMQELCGGTSYVVAHQPALHFGLGEWDQPLELTVRWPSGETQQIAEVAPNQLLILDEPGG